MAQPISSSVHIMYAWKCNWMQTHAIQVIFGWSFLMINTTSVLIPASPVLLPNPFYFLIKPLLYLRLLSVIVREKKRKWFPTTHYGHFTEVKGMLSAVAIGILWHLLVRIKWGRSRGNILPSSHMSINKFSSFCWNLIIYSWGSTIDRQANYSLI